MIEAMFREIFRDMPACAAVYEAVDDGSDFVFIDFNTAAERVDKTKKEEVLGRSVSECFPGVKEFGLFEVLQRVWRTGQPEYFPLSRYKDNRMEGWRENYVFKLSGGQIVAIYDDVTERKQAEERLAKSEAQLSNAVKIAHLGPWEYDAVNDIFTFNDAFYAIFRTTADEAGGYTMSSAEYAKRFVHPDDASIVGEEVRKGNETTDPHYNRQLEHRIIYADGQTGYITVRFFIIKDKDGRTIGTYGVNQDITERKKAEQEIKEQLDKLEIFSKASIGRELKMVELKEKIKELEKKLKNQGPTVS